MTKNQIIVSTRFIHEPRGCNTLARVLQQELVGCVDTFGNYNCLLIFFFTLCVYLFNYFDVFTFLELSCYIVLELRKQNIVHRIENNVRHER